MKSLLMAGALSLASTAAFAAVLDVDFETYAGSDPSPDLSGSLIGGITFTSALGVHIVGVGSPTDGFVPNDNPTPSGAFGKKFLTNDFSDGPCQVSCNADMTMMFAKDLTSIMFDIADIDGGGVDKEIFTVKYFDGATEVGSTMVTSGDANTGDRVVTAFSFAGATFNKVTIFGTVDTTGGNTRNIGWGLDNIVATEVPLPAGAVLILTALGGLGAVRAARRKA